VRFICYLGTLHGHEFLTNAVPVVILCGKLALPDNALGVKHGLCEYFAVYQQQIVGWKLLQWQYSTSLDGQDKTLPPPYNQGWFTVDCAWASVERNWLSWLIDMTLAQFLYVTVPKNQWWNFRQITAGKLTLRCGSEDAFLNIWNTFMLFGDFPELLNAHCLPPSFKLHHANGEFLLEPHLLN